MQLNIYEYAKVLQKYVDNGKVVLPQNTHFVVRKILNGRGYEVELVYSKNENSVVVEEGV